MTKAILAVGAYERDNFGDYLFLEVLRRSLPDDQIVAGSIIFSDTKDGHGTVTVPYDYALQDQKFNAIFVVGGEIGGVDTGMALGMSLTDSVQKVMHIKTSYPGLQDMVNSVYGAFRHSPCAYIPDISRYPLNSNTPLIINSVGISLFGDSTQAKRIVKKASFVSVRESYSASILKRWKVERSVLAPDVVHVMQRLYTPKRQENTYILVQINHYLFRKWGIKKVEKILRQIYAKYGHKIVLLMAGSTNGHDSIKHYKELTKALSDSCDIEIASALPALQIVDLIAGAKATISTSLHVRIVSASYGVPRVSIENEKVTRYVREWDNVFPYNIKEEGVMGALEHVFELSSSKENLINDRATALAAENLKDALSNINNDEVNFDEVQFYKKGLLYGREAVISTISDDAKHIRSLDTALMLKDEQLASYHAQLMDAGKLIDDIMGSNAWKWVTRYREATSKTKRSMTRHRRPN